MIIAFLGRNTEGILADARREFGDQPVLVITRDGDQLQPPTGVEAITVSQFQPAEGVKYTLIANGGTTAQLLPVVKKLVDAADFAAYDLQREGAVELWRSEPKFVVIEEFWEGTNMEENCSSVSGPHSEEEARKLVEKLQGGHRIGVHYQRLQPFKQ